MLETVRGDEIVKHLDLRFSVQSLLFFVAVYRQCRLVVTANQWFPTRMVHLQWSIVEIHHSGRKPSKCFWCVPGLAPLVVISFHESKTLLSAPYSFQY